MNTPTYQNKVRDLLKSERSFIYAGAFTLVVFILGYSLGTQQEIKVTEIAKENREAFIAQQQVKKITYTVLEGEGLWQVAEKTLGDGNFWPEIAKANNITDPAAVVPGQSLVIPSVAPIPAAEQGGVAGVTEPNVEEKIEQNMEQGQIDGGMTQQAQPPASGTYVVLEGEGLWQIAQKIYGDGNMWTAIAQANGLANNPDGISAGMTLTLPSL